MVIEILVIFFIENGSLMKSWCGLTFVSGDDYSLPFNCGWGLVLREAVMTSRYNYFGDVDESC
ncbi:hypothetical protein IMAU10566_02524 [Lactiplantibacillus plantarum]|nr:hypothetical protein [Lactiplantibacillus plantarum]